MEGGTYTELATFVTAGTLGEWIQYVGYPNGGSTGDPCTLANCPVMDGEATRSGCLTSSGTNASYYAFANFRFTDATGINVNVANSSIRLINCRSDNAGTHGIQGAGGLLLGCEIDNNGSSGIRTTQGVWMTAYCKVHSNSQYGFLDDGGGYKHFVRTALYNNTQDDIWYTNPVYIFECTLDGDGKTTYSNIHDRDTSANATPAGS